MIVDSNICCEISLGPFPKTYNYTVKGEDTISPPITLLSFLKSSCHLKMIENVSHLRQGSEEEKGIIVSSSKGKVLAR